MKRLIALVAIASPTLVSAQVKGNWKVAECAVSVTGDGRIGDLGQRTFVVHRGNCLDGSDAVSKYCRLKVRERGQTAWSNEIRVMDSSQNTVTFAISTSREESARDEGKIQIEATAKNLHDRPVFHMRFAESAQMTIPLATYGMKSTFSVSCTPSFKTQK